MSQDQSLSLDLNWVRRSLSIASSVFRMIGSFSEDFATLLAMARSMILMNSDSGRRVTWSLSPLSFGMRSGLLNRVSGPASSFSRA